MCAYVSCTLRKQKYKTKFGIIKLKRNSKGTVNSNLEPEKKPHLKVDSTKEPDIFQKETYLVKMVPNTKELKSLIPNFTHD